MTAPVTDTYLVPPRTTTTPEGAAVTVRRAVPDDLDAVARLHRRCSLETIFRRYFTGVPQMSPALQRRLLQTRLALVAEHDGEVVGLAHLVDDHGDRPAEIAVLVEDAWQRKGIGRALAETVIETAEDWGYDAVVAYTLPSSTASHAMLRRLRQDHPRPVFDHGDDGLVTVTVPLRRRDRRTVLLTA